MEITIRQAQAEDAQAILELLKVFGSETDNLSFGKEGLPITIEQEREYLAALLNAEKDIFFVALRNGEIVGTGNYAAFPQKRMAHRGEIGMSIRKSAWGLGIGSMLLEKLLEFAKSTAKAEIVSLEVRSDNERAINLYKKFGFEKVGCFKGYFKIDNEWIDFDIMEMYL